MIFLLKSFQSLSMKKKNIKFKKYERHHFNQCTRFVTKLGISLKKFGFSSTLCTLNFHSLQKSHKYVYFIGKIDDSFILKKIQDFICAS